MTVGINNPGPLVIATDVDEAILAVMEEWLPTYLKLLSAERNLPYTLPSPKVYTNTVDSDEFMDHQLPALIVTTADTAKTIGGPNYLYRAEWNVTVSFIGRGTNGRATRKAAALSEGAVRRCFLNKCRQNAGPLSSPDWKGTRVAPVSGGENTDRGRFLAAGIGTYNVVTDAAAQGFGGPDVPGADIYVPPATTTGVNLDVSPKQ